MAYLEAHNISKSFGGVHAVQGASFAANASEVHALVGENGAGKSTLLKIVSGLVRPDSGSVRLREKPVTIDRPYTAQRLGIGTVFQELTLLPHMTVAENLLLRQEPRGRLGLVRRGEMAARASELLYELGLPAIDPDALVSALPLAKQQLIEIAKVVLRMPDILLLDEATSALGEKDVEWLFRLIRQLRDKGHTIVFTSHRWKEVASLSDRMTIFRNGCNVATGTPAEIDENRAIELMTGRRIGTAFPPLPPNAAGEPVLRVESLSAGQARNVSFSLHKGEVLGVGGLSGQGQGDLFLTLFGARPPRAGSIFVGGRRVALRHPRDAIDNGIGIALVPEDRKGEGLFLPMSIRHNMSLPILGRISRLGYINRREERRRIGDLINELAIKTVGDGQAVSSLSGGNQQKVLIGRWLLTDAAVLLLYDVTRGVDVATKHDIYALIGNLSRRGTAVVFYSSDTEEMAHLCHRVLVMREGRVAAELVGDEINGDSLIRASLHVDRLQQVADAPPAALARALGS